MLKTLDLLQRVILYALLVPVVVIVLNAIFEAFNAQQGNPIVDAIADLADSFTFEAFETMFPRQSYLQTALVSLAVYGAVVVLVVVVFRVLRSLVSSASRPSSAKRS